MYCSDSKHLRSALCRKGADRLRRKKAIEDARRSSEVVFTVKGAPLESVKVFKYLGRPLSSTDDDWPAIYRNLSKARQRWAQVSRVLVREGADPKTSAVFYKAVVQSVLLYGCESWDMSPRVLKVLSGFHHRAARRLSGLSPWYSLRERRWVYPPVEQALEATGMYDVEHYVRKRQNTLVESIATRPILGLCTDAERPTGSSGRKFWWMQLGE